ncbi:hypothetical protein ABZX69_15935 [Streptomyces sp. NPDC004074]|uniref:aggregation-promoting factor C-terminal-like domain-containing protein n=1 Tax=Streptomyces sp. NPDC004074 TaxID=3154277 RepID=UPI0033AFF838
MPELDIVGSAAVDVIPIAPNFHNQLKAVVLPAADRVGRDAGERLGDAISRSIVVAIPSAIVNGGRAARTAATRQGDDNAGAFARAFKSRLEVAFRSLPRPDVRLSTTGFDSDLARVRSRMETLSNKRIGVDIDDATALAEIRKIDEELARLGARSPSVQVRADIATARAELAAMQRAVNDLGRSRPRVKVDIDTAAAMTALRGLSIALGGVAAIPVGVAAVAGIGAIASAAVAAGAGVGALALAAVPAIKNVTAAIQAKSAAEKEAATATDGSAAAGKRAASSDLQMASAQQSLASARRQAASSIAQANRAVEDAQRSLTDAQRSAQQAEEDLTAARKDAAQQLRDLNDRLLDGVLDQREATLRVQEAQQDLQQVMADPKATELQRERVKLSLDEALRNAQKQKQSNEDLQKQVVAANKAGVDGSKQVQDAQDRVRDANQKVADQERAIADARAKAKDAQVQAADAIASAERGVEAARLSSIDTTSKASTQADAYRKALDKLTPAQRRLYDSLAGPKGLTAAFKAWSLSLAPNVLPLFTRAVDGAKSALPGLTPLVKSAADGVRELEDAASRDLKSPFWSRFSDDIANSVEPAVVGLGLAIGNTFKGAAGIVDAFLPHIDGIADRMVKASRRFANWGVGLKGSPAFESMLRYASEHGPKIAALLGAVVDAALQIGEALAPLSGPVLDFLTGFAKGLADVAASAPWAIQLLWGLYAVQKAIRLAAPLWAVAMTIYTFATAEAAAGTWTWAAALQATGIVPLIEAIVVVIAALGVAVYEAYQHVGWFRTAVDASWNGIKVTTLFLWDKVLKPTFDGIVWAVQGIGKVAMWLWHNAIEPAFKGIWLVARILFAIVVTAVLTPIWIAIQALGVIAMIVWNNGIKPAFNGIAKLALWLWNVGVKPALTNFWNGLKWVGDKVTWLYNSAVKPAVGWIADKAKWLYAKALKPFFDSFWNGLKWVGDKFRSLYNRDVAPVANWIADKADWLYKKGVQPAFDGLKNGVRLVGEAFEKAKTAIGKAWGEVSDLAKKPTNFIIEWVYTKGIKAVWDKVAGFVGLDKLPKAPKLLEAGGTVGDGWGVARPMVTNKPTAIVGEGNPRYPEYVIPTDPKFRGRAKSLWHAAGTQLLAGGGILGNVWDWTKDTVGDVIGKGVDWAKTGTDIFLHPSKIWASLVKPILAKVSAGVGNSPMGKALGKFPAKMANGLKDTLLDAVTGGGGGAALSGLGDLGAHGASAKQAQNIARAMLASFGWGQDQMAPLIKLWNGESGWRWNALNASSGAYGIPQALPAGKMASAGPDWRTNAATQIRWGLGYIKNRPDYGSPAAAWSKWLGRSPHWYDSGGYIPPGLSLVANGTGSPEPVFTGSQWSDIRASAQNRRGFDADAINVYVSTTLDGQELTGHVDKRIELREEQNASDLANGRNI